ncbi:hypothetical protein JZ751_012567 [Albula glossodonta]|uniref:Transmembrane protein 144b n=1 Tax=Albula glossodonta TaxID=121402 RepID=A0A8T2P5Z5_9TELE|nr:hypothetical protein JZ751_012567 [Albula glossodonta]
MLSSNFLTTTLTFSAVFCLVHSQDILEKTDQDAPPETLSQTQFGSIRIQATGNSTNSTELTYGFVSCIVSVLFFGSNFVPVKKIDTGDVGALCRYMDSVFGGKHNPSLSHVLAAGNVGRCNLGNRFGWFGIDPEEVAKPVLNYCGAGLCFLSAIIFFFVKTDVQRTTSPEETPLLIDSSVTQAVCGVSVLLCCFSVLTGGSVLATFSGLLYGSSFIPVLHIKNHAARNDTTFAGASQFDLDYVFAQFSGIFLTSTVYFLIYCAIMKNKPKVYSRAILPATCCWFLANTYLSAVVSFPIITAGPGLIAAVWGVLVFKEVKGVRNCLILALAFCTVLAGALLTAFSKV